MNLQSIGRTHVGRVRAHNEDSLRVDRDHNLFIVADGVGATPRASWRRPWPSRP
ncbi:MAG: hypothetical protein R3F60_25030 [bacterium]